MPSNRERDVRGAIRDILEYTNVFDRVYLGILPGIGGEASGVLRSASIEPNGTVLSGVGDDVGGAIKATASIGITLLARDDDPVARDDTVEMLLNTTAAALNGCSLAGISLPGTTRLHSWEWRRAVPPERRIEAILKFQYLLEGWNGFDVSE